MRLLMLFFVFTMFPSCASFQQKPRESSKFAIVTNDKEVLVNVARALAVDGYQIKTFEKELGVVVTEAREFAIPRGVLKIDDRGRSSVQALKIATGVEIQILYECRYTSANFAAPSQTRYQDAGFAVCKENDYDANTVVPAQDEKVERFVKSALSIR